MEYYLFAGFVAVAVLASAVTRRASEARRLILSVAGILVISIFLFTHPVFGPRMSILIGIVLLASFLFRARAFMRSRS